MPFQARVKIQNVIVAQSDYVQLLEDAVSDAALRLRASGVPRDYTDPLIFEVYYKSPG